MTVGITMSSHHKAAAPANVQMLSIARKQRLQDFFFHRVTPKKKLAKRRNAAKPRNGWRSICKAVRSKPAM